jgi:phage I-like protein
MEPLAAILARRKLNPEEWRAMVDEKLRRRDFKLAGYEPLDGISLVQALQQQREDAARKSAERLRRVAAEMAARQTQTEEKPNAEDR